MTYSEDGSTLGKELNDRHLAKLKQRCRVLLLLDAAERAGIVPLPSSRLHAFAYLADVLSPVWDLVPFDGKVYKSEGPPHYPDLQDELDRLVILGLVHVSNLRYIPTNDGGTDHRLLCLEFFFGTFRNDFLRIGRAGT